MKRLAPVLLAVLLLSGCTCHLVGTQTMCFPEKQAWLPGPSWETP